MLTKTEIEANLFCIEETICKFAKVTELDAVDYLGEITALQSLATETQASAKMLLLSAIDKELDKQLKATLEKSIVIPASVAKMRADSKCAEYHYLYEKAQRFASNVSHTIDAVRTKISWHKQELENSKFQ